MGQAVVGCDAHTERRAHYLHQALSTDLAHQPLRCVTLPAPRSTNPAHAPHLLAYLAHHPLCCLLAMLLQGCNAFRVVLVLVAAELAAQV